jgi:hypothetical protein
MSDGWPCRKCNAQNMPEDRFCGECGAPDREPATDPNPSAHSTITGILPEMKEKPAGALDGAALVIMSGLVAAAVFGAAYHFVGRVFDLLILFPIALGLAVGFVIKMAALKGRCRNGILLLAVAIVSGVAAYGFRQTLDTLKIRGDLTQILKEKPGATVVPPSFEDVLRLRAEAGIGIGRARSAKKNTVTGAGFWIFMLFEAAIVAGVAAASVRQVSLLAYCERCRGFVPSVPIFRVNGRDTGRLNSFIRHQKWKEAQQISNQASPTDTDRAEASLLRCGGCNGSSIRVDLYEGKRSKKVLHVALPPESLEALAKSA